FSLSSIYVLFFFHDTATSEISTLSLHDALPILDLDLRRLHRCPADPQAQQRGLRFRLDLRRARHARLRGPRLGHARQPRLDVDGDRKSTRLNSSHVKISYAVFCLKKKKTYGITA